VKPEAKAEPSKVAAEKPTVPIYRLETVDIPSVSKAEKLLTRMKVSGFTGVALKTLQQERTMKRLFVAEFPDYDSAKAELDNLKKITDGAFIIQASAKYELYAGSYDQIKRAEAEKVRLAGRGVKVSLRNIGVKLPFYRVTGKVKGKDAAEQWVQRLRKQGVESHVYPAAS
jgi:cell division protein FtsN